MKLLSFVIHYSTFCILDSNYEKWNSEMMKVE